MYNHREKEKVGTFRETGRKAGNNKGFVRFVGSQSLLLLLNLNKVIMTIGTSKLFCMDKK